MTRRALLFTAGVAAGAVAQRRTPAPPPEEQGRIGKVVGDRKFVAGMTWSLDGQLLFSDAPSGEILRIGPNGLGSFRDGLAGPRGLAVDPDGRLYVCESRARRVIRIDRRGRAEPVAERWEGKRLNGPNEIALSKSGHLYFTDPAFASADEGRDLPHYGVYHVTPKGEMSLVAGWKTRPNGIALSADERSLYVANSDERSVWVFDIARNVPANGRVFVRGLTGVPDGLRVLAEGRVAVAAADLVLYKPDGAQADLIDLPEKPSCVLEEPVSRTLYAGTANAVYRVHRDAVQ